MRELEIAGKKTVGTAEMRAAEATEGARIARERRLAAEKITAEEATRAREIAREQAIEAAEIARREDVEKARIAAELALEQERIASRQSREITDIERARIVEAAEQSKLVALAAERAKAAQADATVLYCLSQIGNSMPVVVVSTRDVRSAADVAG